MIKDMGSFHVGGRIFEISGQPVKEIVYTPGGVPAKLDPNGLYQVEQMYVQYFIPQELRSPFPLLFWHGGGMSGVTYETTPDGREGWLSMFLKKGWAVYGSDAVERGRSGWPPPGVFQGDPIFLTKADPYVRFRIGPPGSYNEDPSLRVTYPGSQFPVEAYDTFVKQLVPRWTTSDEAILAAYIELIDRVGPCVILFHSQAGQFGFKAAQARPDKVKALVAVEPSSVGDPAEIAALKNIPILFVYGDYINQDARWPKARQIGVDFADKINLSGGHAEVVNLPDVGIKGNSHLMMMEKNNQEVAGFIQNWLAKQGIYR